jgi:hypothetical protein
MEELFKESRPFFYEDMFVLLSLLEEKRPTIGHKRQEAIHQEAAWDSNNPKSLILEQSLKK